MSDPRFLFSDAYLVARTERAAAPERRALRLLGRAYKEARASERGTLRVSSLKAALMSERDELEARRSYTTWDIRLLRTGWIEPVLLERRDPGLGSSEDQGMNVLGSFIGIHREQVH
jgi:hypothetical protein